MLQKQNAQFSIDKKYANSLRIAIVRTDYYITLNDNLEKHAKETLIKHGVLESQIQTFTAPGSWEIPLIAQKVAKSKKFDAIIAFGVIVKGETYHFDMIANECSRSLMQLSLDYSIPIAIEVLAVYDIKQAEKRASDDNHNKGMEGAVAVLKTLSVVKQI